MFSENREKEEHEQIINMVMNAAGDISFRAGMKSSSGKIWIALFLSDKALDAEQICGITGLSTGTVSMGLGELLDIDIILRTLKKGERKFYYESMDELWPVVRKIFNKRTRNYLAAPLQQIAGARNLMVALKGDKENKKVQSELEKISHIIELGDFALDLMDAFTRRTRVEMKAARKWLSVSGRIGGEPLNRLRRRINEAKEDKIQ